MKIRDALESDLGSIAELLLIVHQMHVKAHPETYRGISHDTAVEFLAPRLTESNAHLRVAEFESELQGYCSATFRSYPSIPIFQPRESSTLTRSLYDQSAGGADSDEPS